MLFSRSREPRETVKVIFLIRGSPARLKKQFFSFAGAPRGCQSDFSHPREPREAAEAIFLIRGTPANLSLGPGPGDRSGDTIRGQNR